MEPSRPSALGRISGQFHDSVRFFIEIIGDVELVMVRLAMFAFFLFGLYEVLKPAVPHK